MFPALKLCEMHLTRMKGIDAIWRIVFKVHWDDLQGQGAILTFDVEMPLQDAKVSRDNCGCHTGRPGSLNAIACYS